MQMHEVRPIATEVAWSVCVCVSVGRNRVSLADVPFGAWTRVGPNRNVCRILVSGANAPLPSKAKKILKI